MYWLSDCEGLSSRDLLGICGYAHGIGDILKNTPRPDIYILPATLAGDALAHQIHAHHESIGQRVVDTHDNLHGYLVRVLAVHGKRPGEGQIAANMKTRSTKV